MIVLSPHRDEPFRFMLGARSVVVRKFPPTTNPNPNILIRDVQTGDFGLG